VGFSVCFSTCYIRIFKRVILPRPFSQLTDLRQLQSLTWAPEICIRCAKILEQSGFVGVDLSVPGWIASQEKITSTKEKIDSRNTCGDNLFIHAVQQFNLTIEKLMLPSPSPTKRVVNTILLATLLHVLKKTSKMFCLN
jgi:hypothetical protein